MQNFTKTQINGKDAKEVALMFEKLSLRHPMWILVIVGDYSESDINKMIDLTTKDTERTNVCYITRYLIHNDVPKETVNYQHYKDYEKKT